MREILKVCEGLPRATFDTGEVLLEEGHNAGILYVLVRGGVEVLKGEMQITTSREPGAVFGEVSALLVRPHMATVRALEPSEAYVVEDVMGFLSTNPGLAFSIARLLARRLQSVTSYLVDLKSQFEDSGDHLGMVDEVLESLVHNQSESEGLGESDEEIE